MLACAKHFLGDGGTTDGKDQGNTECDEATLRRIHLAGYRAAIKAGVGSIMVSFSSWNGKKMHDNRHLVTEVLKGELGFQGFLVSDWAAIDQISPDYKADIEGAINAGLDMIDDPQRARPAEQLPRLHPLLKELVAEGRVPAVADRRRRAADPPRQVRSRTFAHPFADPALLAEIGCPEHREIARQCVRESLVLLKNEKHALPLSKEIKHLAVVGKAADDIGIQCGGWTISWQGKPARWCMAARRSWRQSAAPWHRQPKVSYSAEGPIDAAADAVLVVVGEKPYAEGSAIAKTSRLRRRTWLW